RIRNDKRFYALKTVLMAPLDRGGNEALKQDKNFSAYLPKPVTCSDLYDVVTGLLCADDADSEKKPVALEKSGVAEDQVGNQLSQHLDWPADTRILLVEDNHVNQLVAKALLEQFGLACDVAENGLEALKMLENTETQLLYDLVLMDCQMPELDGYSTTTRIRRGEAGFSYKAITIIAMTANAMSGDRDKCISVGMDDYISKPINNNELLGKLRFWLLDKRPKESLQGNI
ncbi:MAG: response regulator, partial [Oleiphilaceae bacterium]|nr:response regulator [Oleiphilaceae bacterium]